MKIVLAFDAFKGSLTAVEACRAAAEGLARRRPAPEVVPCPLSDGGEGFAEALRLAAGGTAQAVEVTGPLFAPVTAEIIFLGDGTAVVESAQACGLMLVPSDRRSPMRTTSFGLGEMLQAAVARGARRLVVGLGGSATHDGGMGMLAALGWRFRDVRGAELPPVGASLVRLARIEPGERLAGIDIVAACDVTNPLCGPTGAAYTFAPQKGATPAEVAELDRGLAHFAELIDPQDATRPGAGAAGGLGYALLTCLEATFHSGAALAIELSGLRAHLRGAALCLTGEGCTDAQTAHGKLPQAVAAACAAAGVPCVCLSGSLGAGWEGLSGFAAIRAISPPGEPVDAAMTKARAYLADAAEKILTDG